MEVIILFPVHLRGTAALENESDNAHHSIHNWSENTKLALICLLRWDESWRISWFFESIVCALSWLPDFPEELSQYLAVVD